MIHHGDCLDVMAGMDAESIDAVVTDPPYGLEFMGKEWDRLDGGLPQENVWKGRRGKGGSSVGTDDSGPASRHHVAFGGTKAGFKRCQKCGKRAFSGSPCVCPDPEYVVEYAQSAPSSAIRMQRWHEAWAREALRVAKPGAYLLSFGGTRTVHRLACAIEDAGWIIRDMLVWGYSTGFPKSKASLKPAWEPIVMARKPGPLRHLNIDGCRIEASGRPLIVSASEPSLNTYGDGLNGSRAAGETNLGRWPANVILTDPIFDGGWDGVVGGGETAGAGNFPAVDAQSRQTYGGFTGARDTEYRPTDTGTYSRFFIIPKASRSDREPVLGGLPLRDAGAFKGNADIGGNRKIGARPDLPVSLRANVHPTVKPVDLMRHLVRLVTPTGGTVLDPFLGSGTTGLAAELEGFEWVGIEREAEYVAIAEARLNGTQKGMAL